MACSAETSMKRALLVILASFVWLIGGAIAIGLSFDAEDRSGLSDVMVVSLLVGWLILLMIGSALWSKAKGYHPILGAILCVIGPMGLLVLTFLPDRTRASSGP